MVTVYGGWLTDAGNYLGKASRGILDIAGKAVNIAATRGGADSTSLITTGESEEASYMGPGLIAGAAVIGLLILAKKRRR